ncbi:MAG: glycosyltransferase [bacterium]
MKITIISTAYPLRGGIAQYTAILYHKLKQKNHTVNVLTFKRQYPKIFFPGRTQLDKGSDESVKIETEPILDSIGPLSWLITYKKIKTTKPDLLIFKFWMPFFAPCFGTICWLTKKFTDTKILYLCDNIIPHERRFGDVALTKFALKKADYFIIQSEVVKNDLLALFPQAQNKVVPHPVYEIFGEVMDKHVAKKEIGLHDERVILFFGYIRAYKGLDLILLALPEILKKINVRLLVVGEFYDSEEKYKNIIETLGIEKSVLIHADFVVNEKVSLYFSAADVVVLPYKSATQSGIVQIAYQLNRPCIVTNVGGLAEVVIHNKTGYVVEPESPVALAHAVEKFYAEDKEREFVENVKVEKKKYSWDTMVKAIEDFVCEVN